MSIRVIQGDCRAILPTLPAGSVHCVVTSPPYYGLRSYLDAAHPDKHREIGSEPTPDAYIATMVAVFREIKRVLRDDGTVWLNMGDSYNSYRGNAGPGNSLSSANQHARQVVPGGAGLWVTDAKPKDLLLMPARLALALQQDGWWIRSDIIISKRNPMPESVVDRCTSAHEHLFMLTKSPRYYFDSEAIREADAGTDHRRNVVEPVNRSDGFLTDDRGIRTAEGRNGMGRNCRDVWEISTFPYKDAHFATFSPVIPERCIRAGTSERGCCAACGAPWVRVVERIDQGWDGSRYGERAVAATGGAKSGGTAASTLGSSNGKLTGKTATTGWSPGCQCGAATVPATVLDPFAGAGTSLLVADRLQRDGVAIELSPAYCAMLRARITADAPLFATVMPPGAAPDGECEEAAAADCPAAPDTP